MFKLVVLLSVAAIAAANPGALLPVAHSAILPGVRTISQYDTSIVHPSSVYTTPIIHASPLAYGTGLYTVPGRLHKRSIVAPAVSYSTIVSPVSPWVPGYGIGGGWASPVVGRHGLGLANVYPRALSVHPY